MPAACMRYRHQQNVHYDEIALQDYPFAERTHRLLPPQGPGINDACLSERIANLITSLPFLGVGWHTLR